MSRIAKYPVDLPKGVEVTLSATDIAVKGPLGTLKQFLLPAVTVERDGEKLLCRAVEGAPNSGAMSGTMRALLNNMVIGVTKGFEKEADPGRRRLPCAGSGFQAEPHLGFFASGIARHAEWHQS
jgi:large subunit ribosomal protein L6